MTREHYSHTLGRRGSTYINLTNNLENQNQKLAQGANQTQKNQRQTFKSATHRLLGVIAASEPHQEPSKPTKNQIQVPELQNTVALLHLRRNNSPRTLWPQPSALSPPPLLPPSPASLPDTPDLEEEEEVAMLPPLTPLLLHNKESETLWQGTFDELEEEEMETILHLEAEEEEDHQEEHQAAEANRNKTPRKCPLPQWQMSKLWEPLPKPLPETGNKQETSSKNYEDT
jgi:hypothetical protein